MSNCKCNLIHGVEIVPYGNLKPLKEFLENFLSVDGDLVDEGNIPEIVAETIGQSNYCIFNLFEDIFDIIFHKISNQEYFGGCDYEIIDLKDGRAVVSWAIGGHED